MRNPREVFATLRYQLKRLKELPCFDFLAWLGVAQEISMGFRHRNARTLAQWALIESANCSVRINWFDFSTAHSTYKTQCFYSILRANLRIASSWKGSHPQKHFILKRICKGSNAHHKNTIKKEGSKGKAPMLPCDTCLVVVISLWAWIQCFVWTKQLRGREWLFPLVLPRW